MEPQERRPIPEQVLFASSSAPSVPETPECPGIRLKVTRSVCSTTQNLVLVLRGERQLHLPSSVSPGANSIVVESGQDGFAAVLDGCQDSPYCTMDFPGEVPGGRELCTVSRIDCQLTALLVLKDGAVAPASPAASLKQPPVYATTWGISGCS